MKNEKRQILFSKKKELIILTLTCLGFLLFKENFEISYFVGVWGREAFFFVYVESVGFTKITKPTANPTDFKH